MGAWGFNNFENDTAGDWIYDFESNPTAGFLQETIAQVFADDFLDADIASQALAAIEVIAAAKRNPSADFPDLEGTDVQLLSPHIDQSLLDEAQKAIARISSEDDNELYELWQESDHFDEWLAVQQSLAQRIADV